MPATSRTTITSHGITDALRDAELLSRAIVSTQGFDDQAALAGVVPDDPGPPCRGALFDITDDIASFDWTIDQIPRLLLRLSDSMSGGVDLLRDLDATAPRPVDGHRADAGTSRVSLMAR
jgi:hypothetical protein